MSRTTTTPNNLSRRPLDQGRGTELAKHKAKIRNQKEEIEKLKRAFRARDFELINLKRAYDYLLKTAEPEARQNGGE